MRPSLTAFVNLPMPVKAAMMLFSGAGLVAILFWLSSMGVFGNAFGYLLLVALAVAALVGGIFMFIMKKMEKRKAKPFEQKLAESNAATPGSVSDPGSRAKLDDLRKRFEEGIQVFKDHGKDLYTMPWYVIVGEPGSGKTEAMRHCNVGFPPGLQNQLQGVGGTVNMHWWFTNQAVMIDTAGRLMFEDLEPGQTSEWSEFLKLLRIARPNCPLNGMLLVIPADSLIKDSANDIERKGGKIAQQLDNIQRALGVRFPVYVIISKADRINGFREFFDDLTDPVTQMQMMGWSNPNDLDTPFDPSMIEQHLKTVRGKLVRRRFALMSDPVHSDDPQDHRIDQVDALYAFPDSLVKLAPRLRRYLEMVFVAGEWSQKPLFLRGIYFTSSMREGDALDADLADVLGVQVDALKEGKLWERERSYFLKDMFMEKVFRERGLVTRESNVSKSRRRQSAILLVGGTIFAVLTGLWTWMGYTQLQKNVGDYRDFWKAVADVVREENPSYPALSVVQPESGDYADGRMSALDLGPVGRKTRLEVQVDAHAHAKAVEAGVSTSLIFLPVRAVQGDVWNKLQTAQESLFDRYVVQAFLNESRRRMLESASDEGRSRVGSDWWHSGSVGVLGTLMSMQKAGLSGVEWKPTYEVWLSSLGNLPEGSGFSATVPSDQWEPFAQDVPQFVAIMTSLYGEDAAAWARVAKVDAEDARKAVRRGAASFSEAWRPSGGGESGLLRLIEEFAREGTVYDELEAAVLTFEGFGSVASSAEFEQRRKAWLEQVGKLGESKAKLDALMALEPEVEIRPGQPPLKERLGEVLSRETPISLATKAKRMATSEVDATFKALIDAIPTDLSTDKTERAAELSELRRALQERQTEYVRDVDTRVDALMDPKSNAEQIRMRLAGRAQGSTRVHYQSRFERIAAVAGVIERDRDRAGTDVFALGRWAGVLKSDMDRERSQLPSQTSAMEGMPRFELVRRVGTEALNAYESFNMTAVVRDVLKELSEGEIRSLVKSGSAAQRERLSLGLDTLPMVSATDDRNTVNPDYDWRVAREVFSSIAAINARVSATTGVGVLDRETEISPAYQKLSEKLRAYAKEYVNYWRVEVPKRYAPSIAQGTGGAGGAWAATWAVANDVEASLACQRLSHITARLLEAMEAVPAEYRADSDGVNVNDFITALQRDQSSLAANEIDQLRRQAETARDAWVTLNRDPGPAHRVFSSELRSLPASSFKNKYLATVSEAGMAMTPARVYWSGFVEAMMEAMWQSYANDAAEAVRQLRQIPPAFPLALDGTTFSTPEEVERARQLVTKLLGEVGTGQPVGEGSRSTNIPGIPDDLDRKLARLKGQGVFESAAQEAWIRNLNKVTSALSTEARERVQIEIVLVGNAEQNAALSSRLRRARVTSGGQPIRALSTTDGWMDPGLTQGVSLGQLEVPLRSGAIQFEFAPSEQLRNDVKVVGEIPGPWHGLLAMKDANPQRSADGPLLMPLVMRSQQAGFEGLQYFVGVKISGGALPSRDEWPRVSDWPR
ncbi:MAG: hypothetical protein KF757_07205 [Phycisphaeraceae bacterium]|nr:hypothetical protein [Phycisphaeraceae bacterium]MCW5763381.1 hypothetical protein [Phycisphaeraceae bacterium]